MQITETGSEQLKKIYRVTIDAADITRATEAELKTLSKRVKIPGFRPGFVPMKVMQQRYGRNVRDDVIKNVVTDATEKAITGNKLRIALQPDVKVEEYQEGQNLVFTLSVDVMPDVPEVSFGNVSIEREVFEVDDEAVDKALKLMAESNPTPVPQPAGTKAGQGDMVSMDFIGKVDGTAFEGGTAEGFRIIIGSGRLIPGFEDQLVGVAAGDKREVRVAFPKDYFSKELAGKDAVFDVEVREVLKLDTPAIDDAFAKERGMKDLAALREAIQGRLTQEYNGIVRTRLKKRLFDALEDLYTFPLPAAMVQMEYDAIWGRLQQNKAQGVSDEELYEGKTEAEMQEEYRRIAERRVKLGIVLAEVGRVQKIQVSREELSRAVGEQAAQFPGQERAVFDFYRKNPARVEEFRGPILEEKAVDWVLAQVKMQDKPATIKELLESAEDEESSDAPQQKSEKKATPKKKASSAKKKTKED